MARDLRRAETDVKKVEVDGWVMSDEGDESRGCRECAFALSL